MSFFQELLEASAKAAKAQRELIDVPEWAEVLNGRKVYIQKMSLEDRDAWEAEGLIKKGDDYEPKLQDMRARLLKYVLVDEDGVKLFPNTDTARQLPAYIGDPIYKRALALNRLTKESVEADAKNS